MGYNPILCDLKSLLVIQKLIHLEQYKNPSPKDRKPKHSHSYIVISLLITGPTFIYSHIVMASKFLVIQKSHRQKGDITVYGLLESNYEQIKGIIDDYNSSEDKSSDDQHNDDDNR